MVTQVRLSSVSGTLQPRLGSRYALHAHARIAPRACCHSDGLANDDRGDWSSRQRGRRMDTVAQLDHDCRLASGGADTPCASERGCKLQEVIHEH